MFDPNVSDPLVIEQGAEMYGVILPLEIVVHAGIFSDIAMMKVEKGLEINVEEKPKLYGGECGGLLIFVFPWIKKKFVSMVTKLFLFPYFSVAM